MKKHPVIRNILIVMFSLTYFCFPIHINGINLGHRTLIFSELVPQIIYIIFFFVKLFKNII